jgi:hypothetical protein
VGFLIRDKNGVEVIGTNCVVEKVQIRPKTGGELCVVEFSFVNILKPGSYSIALAVGLSDEQGRFNLRTLDWVDNACVFVSEPDYVRHVHSLVMVPVEIAVHE